MRYRERIIGLLICEGKYSARGSIMAQKDSHETSSSENNYRGTKSVGHHGCMESKHFAHMVLQRKEDYGKYSSFRVKKRSTNLNLKKKLHYKNKVNAALK